MKNYLKLAKSSALLAAMACSAGSMAVTFFGTPGDDRAKTVIPDPATGGFYVAGTAYKSAAKLNDLYVIRYSAGGVPLWTYSGGGNGNDTAYGLALRGNNLYVVGETQPVAGAPLNGVVLRLDTVAGALVASQVFALGGNDAAKLVRLDGAGNVFVGGYATVGGSRDYLIAKYTPALAPLFMNVWGGPNSDEPLAMGLSANGVYLAGQTTNAAGNLDATVARFSGATGAYIFARTVAGAGGGNDWFSDMAIDGAGAVYLSGAEQSAASGEQGTVMKLSANLAFMAWSNWLNYSPGAGADRSNRLILTAGNTVTVGGRSWAPVGVGYDATLSRFDRAGGGAMGLNFYSDVDHDEILDLAEGPAGEVYAAIASDGVVGHDYATARFDGGLTWVQRFNNINHDEPAKLCLTGGNVVVTGASEVAGMAFDWATLGYNAAGVPVF